MSYGEFIISALPISKILTTKYSLRALDQDNSPESEAMKRRVKSRCGGLLEISPNLKRQSEEDPVHGVQFLHQTVKEFLDKEDIWEKIFGVKPLPGLIEAHRHLLISSLHPLRADKIASFDAMESCTYHAWKVEQLDGNSPVELLDTVNEVASETDFGLCVDRWYIPDKSWNDDFLTLAIFKDLALYVKYKVQLDLSLARKRKGRPLLHYAVNVTSFMESRFGELVVVKHARYSVETCSFQIL